MIYQIFVLLLVLNKEETEQRIKDLGWWYMHFTFPNGVKTGTDKDPGYDAENRWRVIEPFVPKDLTGKTCLDLGGNAGYFSIQMKLRGASRCVLVDPFDLFLRQAEFSAEQFGVELETINDDAHTYCLTTEERFDYIIFLGLFYHLKYPGLVLDRLAEMTKERIYIESAMIGPGTKVEEFKPKQNYERWKEDDLLGNPNYPKLAFIETLYNNDPTNWWLPNQEGLSAMVRSSGLKIIDRPHFDTIIAEPEYHFGKTIYEKLVFPNYGKKNGSMFPGPQEYGKNSISKIK